MQFLQFKDDNSNQDILVSTKHIMGVQPKRENTTTIMLDTGFCITVRASYEVVKQYIKTANTLGHAIISSENGF